MQETIVKFEHVSMQFPGVAPCLCLIKPKKSEGADLQETIVKFEHVSMQFPGVLANDDVSFDIRKGEIFALVGENGAGKSTLMNILYGINTPTAVEVYIKCRKMEKHTPTESIENGVGMVHQHFMLVPSFTVAQNIVLSKEPRKNRFCRKMEKHTPTESIENGVGMVHQHFMLVPSFTVAQNIVLSKEPRKNRFFYDLKGAVAATEQLVKDYGLIVDPKAVVEEISVGLQQRVEILKTLYRGADILILDEPTAVLTPQETEELFDVIRRIVREKNMTVIIITHKLNEVMAISDRVGVMRQGKLVGVEETKNVNEKILASMMVGRDVLGDFRQSRRNASGQIGRRRRNKKCE